MGMRARLALGFVLLVACAKSPTAPDPSVEIEEPAPEPIPEPKPDPLTPEEGRALLQEAGVPYSQASFLSAAGGGDRPLVEAFVAAGMDPNVQNEDEGYDTALMRASAARPPRHRAVPAGARVPTPTCVTRPAPAT